MSQVHILTDSTSDVPAEVAVPTWGHELGMAAVTTR